VGAPCAPVREAVAAVTIRARGDNATVVFDGFEVYIERHNAWRSRINDTIAEAVYPLEQILAIQLFPADRQQTGVFDLVFDARNHPDHTPMSVEFQHYRQDVFHDLAATLTEALLRVVRYPYPGGPMPWIAGAVVQTPGAVAPVQPYAPAVMDLAGQFQALAAQRAAGILTEAEFAAAKAKLLGMAPEPTDSVP
jgi:hypothetical protein